LPPGLLLYCSGTLLQALVVPSPAMEQSKLPAQFWPSRVAFTWMVLLAACEMVNDQISDQPDALPFLIVPTRQ
jgi:hypothetical protein